MVKVDWLLLSSEYSTPRPESFAPRAVAAVDDGLVMAADHLRATSKRASKERCDLYELEQLSGERHAQFQTVPDALYGRWKDVHQLQAIELLPARMGAGTTIGGDAVVLLLDQFAAVKGLPHNELASRLAGACGRASLRPRGDVFLCRLRLAGEHELALGGNASAEMMGDGDWLAKAQKCAAAVGGMEPGAASTLQEAIEARLAAAVPPAAPATAAAPAAPATAAAPADAAPALGTLTWENSGDSDDTAGGGAEVTVRVAVPAATKSKHVKLLIKAEWLRLEVETLTAAGVPSLLVDDMLFYPVQPDECAWALEDDAKAGVRWLMLTLQKRHLNMKWLDLTRRNGTESYVSAAADS